VEARGIEGVGAGALGQTASRVWVEVYLRPLAWRCLRYREAKAGLLQSPRELSPKWLYDERGSRLFEEITRQPEYYPTRREREILSARAGDVARLTRARWLVELGSGASKKTRLLLDALRDEGTLEGFTPFDVSEEMLRGSSKRLAWDYPSLQVHGVVGDFEQHLSVLPRHGRRLLALLGGTLGNFKPGERARFLGAIRASMGPEDFFLLGSDLLKETSTLEAAYNDAAGVTAAFNLNVLEVLNRELGAGFVPSQFQHVARFDAEHGWIEMLLRAKRAQRVRISSLQASVSFAEGETLRTEVSTKFDRDALTRELTQAGFARLADWTDDRGDFWLTLWSTGRATD
jgi:L-histidine N-alpha-methyltransferase